jgi:hypothetical protein
LIRASTPFSPALEGVDGRAKPGQDEDSRPISLSGARFPRTALCTREEGWGEGHSTRTKRWLISLLNAAKKQPTVSITRGILDLLPMAVAKEQRKTASNNSQLSLHWALKEDVQKFLIRTRPRSCPCESLNIACHYGKFSSVRTRKEWVGNVFDRVAKSAKAGSDFTENAEKIVPRLVAPGSWLDPAGRALLNTLGITI